MHVSDQPTLGEFVKSKMLNMARWIETEICAINRAYVDIVGLVQSTSMIELICMAEVIHNHKHMVIHKDWSGIIRVMHEYNLGAFAPVLMAVRDRPSMHERFWRYMQLLCDVCENSNGAVRPV
ncbi:hypothetical protein [Pleurochrysis sp. endemic virus 1b]|nr:hypothetical protein [Pleurochrysis sp. endemic virus 1b]